jgi:nitrogen fixation protein NifU and related proteins
MFTPAMLDHFEKPRNVGELSPPALMAEATNPVCGDILRLWLLLEGGRVREARFKAQGCVAAIAAASLLTETIIGMQLEEAARISATQLSAALGGLPPESGHAADLAEQALRAALRQHQDSTPGQPLR